MTDDAMTKSKSKLGWWWLAIVVLILIIGFGLWRGGYLPTKLGVSENYQAVFLTNNQVYFGKMERESMSGNFVRLIDIFYLQVSQPLQPSQPAQNVNLVKLGNELHGPADSMNINRDHILFIEDLTPESQVLRAITKYKQDQKKPA